MSTVHEIDQRIADLDSQQAAISDRRIEIKQLIADNWNGPNTKLETEYSQLEARQRGGDLARERLYQERAAAEKMVLIEQFKAACREYAEKMVFAETFHAETLQMERDLHTKKQQNEHHTFKASVARGTMASVAQQLRDLGMDANALGSIETEHVAVLLEHRRKQKG